MVSEMYKCGFSCFSQTFYLLFRGDGMQSTKPTRIKNFSFSELNLKHFLSDEYWCDGAQQI